MAQQPLVYDTATGQFTGLPGVIDAEQFIAITAASGYTLTSQTAAQQLFNTTTKGAVTLGVNAFFFECVFALSGLSAVNSTFGFALTPATSGGCTIAGQAWTATAAKPSALATPVAASMSYNTAANTALVGGSTATYGIARINGRLRTSVAGLLVPQVSLSVASAAVVALDSYFRIWPVGTAASVGPWT